MRGRSGLSGIRETAVARHVGFWVNERGFSRFLSDVRTHACGVCAISEHPPESAGAAEPRVRQDTPPEFQDLFDDQTEAYPRARVARRVQARARIHRDERVLLSSESQRARDEESDKPPKKKQDASLQARKKPEDDAEVGGVLWVCWLDSGAECEVVPRAGEVASRVLLGGRRGEVRHIRGALGRGAVGVGELAHGAGLAAARLQELGVDPVQLGHVRRGGAELLKSPLRLEPVPLPLTLLAPVRLGARAHGEDERPPAAARDVVHLVRQRRRVQVPAPHQSIDSRFVICISVVSSPIRTLERSNDSRRSRGSPEHAPSSLV